MKFLLIGILGLSLYAEDPKPKPAPPKMVDEQEKLILENISLKEALVKVEYNNLMKTRKDVEKAICQRVGIPADRCDGVTPDGRIMERPVKPAEKK